ncbi:MAG: ATP-binding cassette domain-containing protein [Planctomycetaceae bacterium]
MTSATTSPPGDPAATRDHPETSPLSIHDMTVAYHRRPVLWDVDYIAPAGRLVAIVGPNGAGKSTLIKAALDLIPKVSGDVRVFGRPYREQRARVAYVPQRTSVDWDFPVSAAGRRHHRIVPANRLVTAGDTALEKPRTVGGDRVGLAEYASRQISQLSGGQQQRVFLARALGAAG